MNTVNTHARRAKGVITMMPKAEGYVNGCRRRGERVRRSPLWSIRGREYTGGTDVTDLAFVGAHRRRRYEPRNSIPPFGASPTRTLKGNNRNQQVTKKENLDVGIS